ncbi:MAG TPA: prephenate dehydrogenase, partial [Gemmatimonadales bacterium]|nr:prephenate dehydrogenase [Gemmatimonadales bacterium]
SAVSEVADSPVRAVRGAELVVLAVPPGPTLDLIGRLASSLEPGAILTDVCSVKAPVMARAADCGLGDRFAGSHPLAGTHDSGFLAARPDRLLGCVVYVCESASAEGARAARGVMRFWEEVFEAQPILISAEAHDRQLAWTSHLPQAVAYALAKSLADRRLGGVSYGTGARDTTRLAASSPDMWLDILLQNRDSLVEALSSVEGRVGDLRRLIEAGDRTGLEYYLETAREFRRGLDR